MPNATRRMRNAECRNATQCRALRAATQSSIRSSGVPSSEFRVQEFWSLWSSDPGFPIPGFVVFFPRIFFKKKKKNPISDLRSPGSQLRTYIRSFLPSTGIHY